MPVYKSKEVTKDGRKWFFKCQYKDAYGEIHTKKSKKYAGKGQAEEAERLFLLNCGKTVSNKIIWNNLVNEFLENSHNKDGTLYSKKITLNKYGQIFQDKDINNITPQIVEKWKKEINNNYDLVTSSKQNIYNYFKTVLDYAIKKLYITINPFRIVDNFKDDPDELKKKRDEELLYITPEEFNQFVSVIDNEFWLFFFSFAYFMGTRKGEQVGLQWKDVDFKNHKIKIYKQLNIKGLKKKKKFIPTKNGRERTLGVPDRLWEILESQYEKESKIVNFSDESFVFGGNKHTSYTTIDRWKDKYFKKSGVKRITMHQFRHSHASLLISNDISINLIAERLGDTPDVILNTYAHLFPQTEKKILNVLNSV